MSNTKLQQLKIWLFSRFCGAVSDADHESGVSFLFWFDFGCENARLLRTYEIIERPKKEEDYRLKQQTHLFNKN